MSNTTISTILLDAGGVVLDEQDMETVRARETTLFLKNIDQEYSIDRYWTDIEESVQSFCPETYLYIFWKYTKPNRELCASRYESFLKIWRQKTPPLSLMSGIDIELKKLAKKYQIGLAGQYGKEIFELLEKNDLTKYFSWKHTQDDFSLTKPDPRFYEQILRTFAVKPEQCVMVGDRIDKDIIPAKQVGMKTIRIRTGIHNKQQPRIPKEIPDLELEDVRNLFDAVERLT